ncbi:g3465 [Coccomyxa elongata]
MIKGHFASSTEGFARVTVGRGGALEKGHHHHLTLFVRVRGVFSRVGSFLAAACTGMPAWQVLVLILGLSFVNAIADTAGDAAAPGAVAGSTFRVLILGNSLSFVNDGTYQVVANLVSQQFPDTALEAVQIAQTGEFLSDHLNKAGTPGTYEYAALSAESVEKWDYVILQEESEQVALGGGDALGTRDAIAGLAKLADARGARAVGVVLTWAWQDGTNDKLPSFEDMQDKVNAGYMDLIQDLQKDMSVPLFLAPVGLAWQAVHSILVQEAIEETLGSSERDAAGLGNPAASAQPFSQALLTAICNHSSEAPAAAPDVGRRDALAAPAAAPMQPSAALEQKPSADGPEVTVPATFSGIPVRQDLLLPAQSASGSDDKRDTGTDDNVDICKEGTYPAGWDTFKQMYSDDYHPSEQGTYLEGLIIASAMTGCRMKGNPYGRNLEAKWVSFLQLLSDAVVFQTTSPAFPQQLWVPEGASCKLR